MAETPSNRQPEIPPAHELELHKTLSDRCNDLIQNNTESWKYKRPYEVYPRANLMAVELAGDELKLPFELRFVILPDEEPDMAELLELFVPELDAEWQRSVYDGNDVWSFKGPIFDDAYGSTLITFLDELRTRRNLAGERSIGKEDVLDALEAMLEVGAHADKGRKLEIESGFRPPYTTPEEIQEAMDIVADAKPVSPDVD